MYLVGKQVGVRLLHGNIFPKHSRVAKAVDQSMCVQNYEALLADALNCLCLSPKDEPWLCWESSKAFNSCFRITVSGRCMWLMQKALNLWYLWRNQLPSTQPATCTSYLSKCWRIQADDVAGWRFISCGLGHLPSPASSWLDMGSFLVLLPLEL